MYSKTVKKRLSFEGQKLTRGRHKIHPYPAMLHPLLVDFLIDEYANEGDVIFDPFCGSGVTLLQSSVRSHKSLGFDINPLALLVAKTKTTKYDISVLKKEFEHIKKRINRARKSSIPTINNIDYWYTKDVTRDLGRIRHVLKNSKHYYQYFHFFLTTFAFTCRHQSLTRNGEFKRYRIKADKVAYAKNEVIDKFFDHTMAMIKEFESSDVPKLPSKPIRANSEEEIGKKIKYNLIITSPPYGDSRTTLAYGDYSSFGSEWTDDLHEFGNTNYRVDNECLGKAGQLNDSLLKQHKTLDKIFNKIRKEDPKRANDVLNFFNGYYNVIRNVVRNLEDKGTACFVVGNRTVKNHQIPMDQITASFFDRMGLVFKGIFVRDIHNKVMPSKNSPSNKVGVKSKTMTNEYVVVFGKG